jgi:hypothetical protein
VHRTVCRPVHYIVSSRTHVPKTKARSSANVTTVHVGYARCHRMLVQLWRDRGAAADEATVRTCATLNFAEVVGSDDHRAME